MLNLLIQELYQEWDIENPPPQAMPGIFTIQLEEGVSLTISSFGQGGIFLSANVAPIESTQGESFFTHALRANMFGQGTSGASLGLNDAGNLLTLSHIIDYDVNFKEFRDIVEDFINTMDYWREETMKYAGRT